MPRLWGQGKHASPRGRCECPPWPANDPNQRWAVLIRMADDACHAPVPDDQVLQRIARELAAFAPSAHSAR